MKNYIYLCWRKLSWRLKYFPQISQENVTSGLLWVRSCIIKLYGLVKRRWQNLQTNSHFGRILRRKSDRRSSLSIRITANILADLGFLLFATRDCRSFSHSLTLFLVRRSTKSLFPKCVLNGLLTRCSCNPRFVALSENVAQETIFSFLILSLDGQKKTLIRWRSCHSNKFCRMKNWNEKKKSAKCKRKKALKLCVLSKLL